MIHQFAIFDTYGTGGLVSWNGEKTSKNWKKNDKKFKKVNKKGEKREKLKKKWQKAHKISHPIQMPCSMLKWADYCGGKFRSQNETE